MYAVPISRLAEEGRPPLTRALIFERSYLRIKSRIDSIAGVETIIMTQDRKFLMGGKEIDIEEAPPEVGWLNLDLFQNPAIGGYLRAILGSPALKWIQSGAAGFDNPVFGEFVKKGARLTTNNAQSIAMAEYVLATVLDHFQRGPERRKAQIGHRWDRIAFREVMKSRWLIVGFGAIGRETAKRARACGAHITGVRRSSGIDELADRMILPDELQAHLPTSDVVVLSLPLSKQTEGMVDAKFLAAMKADGVLVNVGRGGLVDENALLTALDAGRPEFAILDVFRTEPLPADSPFWSHKRVALTAHASANGSGLVARGDDLFLENLRRFTKSEPLINEANAKDVQSG
jgi:phosphoglycerate dehydrogenase-like enzyme